MSDMRAAADSGTRRVFARADVIIRIWDGAGDWVARSRRWRIMDPSTDAARIRDHLRRRMERVIEDLEARRARVLASLEERMARVAGTLARRAPVSRGEVEELHRRLVGLEQRIEVVIGQIARTPSSTATACGS